MDAVLQQLDERVRRCELVLAKRGPQFQQTLHQDDVLMKLVSRLTAVEGKLNTLITINGAIAVAIAAEVARRLM